MLEINELNELSENGELTEVLFDLDFYNHHLGDFKPDVQQWFLDRAQTLLNVDDAGEWCRRWYASGCPNAERWGVGAAALFSIIGNPGDEV